MAFSDLPVFQRALTVGLKDPVTLDIAVEKGDVIIRYSRDGQVSIYASAQDAAGKTVSSERFESTLTIEQIDTRITIRDLPHAVSTNRELRQLYILDVPSRTEVTSTISGAGNQTVIGIAGPVTLITGIGDIDASYIRYGLVKAETGRGKILCVRAAQVEAQTGSGSITLMEDGPSRAIVKKGLGSIEVRGARAGFVGSTDRGELHIKAVLVDDWKLDSVSGNIRIELPPRSNFEADLATKSGEISVERAYTYKLDTDSREFHRKVNGGGKHIQARSRAGNISIE